MTTDMPGYASCRDCRTQRRADTIVKGLCTWCRLPVIPLLPKVIPLLPNPIFTDAG